MDELNVHLQPDVTSMKVDSETDYLNTVVDAAIVCENARDRRETLRNNSQDPPKEEVHRGKPKHWTRSEERNGAQHFKPGTSNEKPTKQTTERLQANAVSPPGKPEAGYRPPETKPS